MAGGKRKCPPSLLGWTGILPSAGASVDEVFDGPIDQCTIGIGAVACCDQLRRSAGCSRYRALAQFIDGSVFVTSGGVNPTSTIQALALYIADQMKQRLATLFD